jgi:hypothetical protein
MLSPGTGDSEARDWIALVADEIRQIRQTYKQSGLYRNDGSTDPLWTVDWYAFGVIVASDGVHLIRHGPWASSGDQEAITFFANGELLQSYRIKELVDIPILLPQSVSHFDWVKSDAFDDAKLEYSITTHDGNRIRFDAGTGQIVSSLRPARLIGVPILGVGFCVLAWLVIRRRRQKSQVRSATLTPRN